MADFMQVTDPGGINQGAGAAGTGTGFDWNKFIQLFAGTSGQQKQQGTLPFAPLPTVNYGQVPVAQVQPVQLPGAAHNQGGSSSANDIAKYAQYFAMLFGGG